MTVPATSELHQPDHQALRIEAAWHLASLERGEPMPTIAAPVHQKDVDAVPFDFEENLNALEGLFTRFCTALRAHSLRHGAL